MYGFSSSKDEPNFFISLHRSTALPVVGFNPEYYMSSYSEYNTSKSGLKIELLYRKVGWKVWYKAFNSVGKPTVLLQIKENDVVSVCR